MATRHVDELIAGIKASGRESFEVSSYVESRFVLRSILSSFTYGNYALSILADGTVQFEPRIFVLRFLPVSARFIFKRNRV